MNFLNNFRLYLPYLLPSLLIFSRTLTDITVILVCLFFLIHCVIEKKFYWLNEGWFKLTIVFVIYLVFVNSFFSLNQFDTIKYSITFLRWPLFAIAIAYWIFDYPESFNKLLVSIPITFGIFFCDLWFQFLIADGGILGISSNPAENRLSVPFSNNLIPGRLITLFTFILLTSYFFKMNLQKKIINFNFVFLIIFVGLISTFITGERVSFIIFTSSLFFIALGLVLNDKKNYLNIIFFLLIISIVLLFFYFLSPNTFNRTIISSFDKLLNLMDSDYGEVFITSYEKWKNNIFFGSGLHQYINIDPIYGYKLFREYKIYHAHNMVLNLLVETGIIGLVLFYSMIFSICIKIINSNLVQTILFSNLILIYINFFPLHTHFKLSHNWINGNAWFAIGLILAIINIYEKKNNSHNKNKFI